MRNGHLFIVSGPSGTGKGTVIKALRERRSDVWLSVSHTTRNPRAGEVDAVDYHFITVEEFRSLIDQQEFLEWAEYSKSYYGTLRKPVELHIQDGFNVLLEIDVQGAFQVIEKIPDAHLVFIEPPSLEELERRLRARGTDDDEVIERRMEAAVRELAEKRRYDLLIVNDVLEDAIGALDSYLDEISKSA